MGFEGGLACCVYVNGCVAFVCMSGSGGILLWLCVGLFVRDDGLVVGVHLGVGSVWGLRCERLGLFVVCVFSLTYVGFCVFGDVVLSWVSLVGVGSGAMRGRLRFLGCGIEVWWLRLLITVLWVCGGA